MPNYQVSAPDGTNYQVTAPDGATQDQVMQYVQQQHAAKAPAPSGQSPEELANAAGIEAGKNETGVVAGAAQAARQYLPFGLGDTVGAGARYLGQRMMAVQNPDSYKTDVAYTRGQSQGEAEGSPTAATLGGTLGGVGQAVAMTPLLKAAMPFKAALALKAGSKIANAARLAATGAVAGGEYGAVTGLVHGQNDGADAGDTAADVGAGSAQGAAAGIPGAALGAAGGATVARGATALSDVMGGMGAGTALKKAVFSDAGTKSIALLAKSFGVSPADMQTVYSKFLNDAGRMPSLGELTDLYNRGEIARMVGKNPNLGAAVTAAANDSATALPGRMNQAVENSLGNGEDQADLVKFRDSTMDAAMAPIKQDKIPLTPEEVEFMRGKVLPNAGVSQLGRRELHQSLDEGHMTVENADVLRRGLNKIASARPGEGHADLANGIEQMARDSSPEYSDALDQFANDSNYIDGHAHGLTGATEGQTKDAGLIAALATPDGKAGYQSGITTRLANNAFDSETGAAGVARDVAGQSGTAANLGETFRPVQVDALRDAAGAETRAAESLDAISSTTPKPKDRLNMQQTGLAMVSHSPAGKVLHLLKAIPGLGMSDGVAQKTAQYLTDPRMAQQGINLMAKHGLDAAATRALMTKAGVYGVVATAPSGGQ